MRSISLLASGAVSRPSLRNAQPQMAEKAPTAVGAALATSLALALASSNPVITHAAVEPPAVVQQYGGQMIAGADDELRDAQKKFLEERSKMKQTYDTDTESTFIDASMVADKKSIYVTLVGGLVIVAFVAPMLQFFYYTGGD